MRFLTEAETGNFLEFCLRLLRLFGDFIMYENARLLFINGS